MVNEATPIELDSTVERQPDLLQQPLDDDLLMADMETGRYYGVSASARRVWDLLERPARVDELCSALAAEYDADIETMRRDVLEFLGQLASHGLLRVRK